MIRKRSSFKKKWRSKSDELSWCLCKDMARSSEIKLEAWSVLLISQPCLSLPDGECLFGSRGGWRGVMNLKPNLLVQELITSGYKKDEAKRSRFEV
ncbi:hypothetical protein YC2023_094364 [Brassica napus]